MEPAGAPLAEDLLPVHVSRLQLGNGGIGAVGDAQRAAHAVAPLGEVQAVAHLAADAVIGHPLDHGGVHAALENQVLHQIAHVVLGKSCHDAGLHAEAAAQAAGHVVLAAALPDVEAARRAHAGLAGIKAQHDFTQGNLVIHALALVLQFQIHCHRPPFIMSIFISGPLAPCLHYK